MKSPLISLLDLSPSAAGRDLWNNGREGGLDKGCYTGDARDRYTTCIQPRARLSIWWTLFSNRLGVFFVFFQRLDLISYWCSSLQGGFLGNRKKGLAYKYVLSKQDKQKLWEYSNKTRKNFFFFFIHFWTSPGEKRILARPLFCCYFFFVFFFIWSLIPWYYLKKDKQ